MLFISLQTFSNLTDVIKGHNNEFANTLANIFLLNYVWHTQNYSVECSSMKAQIGGYFRFL